MPTAHPRPWHRHSVFGPGIQHPLDRERRAVWKARIEMHRRAGRITANHALVAAAMLRRLGQDGRLDPAHQTLAADAGVSVSTTKRALKALADCGLVSWIRRIARQGQRVMQVSNSYLLSLGQPPAFPANRCECQRGRETLQRRDSSVQQAVLNIPEPARREAQAALARRRAVVEQELLTRGAVATA